MTTAEQLETLIIEHERQTGERPKDMILGLDVAFHLVHEIPVRAKPKKTSTYEEQRFMGVPVHIDMIDICRICIDGVNYVWET